MIAPNLSYQYFHGFPVEKTNRNTCFTNFTLTFMLALEILHSRSACPTKERYSCICTFSIYHDFIPEVDHSHSFFALAKSGEEFKFFSGEEFKFFFWWGIQVFFPAQVVVAVQLSKLSSPFKIVLSFLFVPTQIQSLEQVSLHSLLLSAQVNLYWLI